jgi:hypothetical protein
MTYQTQFHNRLFRNGLAALLALFMVLPVGARVLDNFNDNTKTAWADSTFIPGFGIPVEADGQLTFTLGAVGQSIFSGSVKTSETFTLQDGRTVEFRVDMVTGYGGDSFAVLYFLPQGQSVLTLTGYGLAKSSTDILITKGINKYFVDEATAIKNDNVTLVMSLTGKGTSVIINAKVLDKDNNDAVLWERTVVDTAGADMLADGTDSPAAPFMGSGNFGLLCYEDNGKTQDYYQVVYDNAEVYVMDSTVLDDFNDNTKTAWADSTFIPGFGIPQETDGQFNFLLPAAGQSIFTGSVKTSRTFDIVDGERVEFRVDLVTGYLGDSFAVLYFQPEGQSVLTLTGYGLAKSSTDILITKGINKYFVNEATAIKNDNVTLVMSFTGKGTSVIINAKVLDKDNNDEVLWERTVVDTAGADVMADGTDDPAAPFMGRGNYSLLCYEDEGDTQDYYQVIFDNAVVLAPPIAGNTAPIITELLPKDGANFLPASTQISFKVTDDKAVPAGGLSVTLNGTVYTTANGLAVSGGGTSVTAALGGLVANTNYVATVKAVDSDGADSSVMTYFDTFATSLFVIEIEDYNFDGGSYFTDPTVVPEGAAADNAYSYRMGLSGVDYADNRASPNGTDTKYRPDDPVRMQHSLDIVRKKFADAGGADWYVFDYDVGDNAVGDWLNFTRDFTPGSYEVYLREAVANMDLAESALELVTSDRTQPDQTTTVLGSFLGRRSGFTYRNCALTDGAGVNRVILRLSGTTTLRLRTVTADASDAARYMNYMVFLPVAETGVQRATVSAASPAQGAVAETVAPVISATIQNRDTSVQVNTVVLKVNGNPVAATVTATADGATVTYALTPLPAPNSVITANLSFTDNLGVEVASEWSFTITYKSLDAANCIVGTGGERGFYVRVVQAPKGEGPPDNSLVQSEQQLAPNSPYPAILDTNTVLQVVNMAQPSNVGAGYFPDKEIVPGIDPDTTGTDDDFAVDIQGYLELAAGAYRFGVVSDDGFKLSSGAKLGDKEPILAYEASGTANQTFEFVVPASGFYPFRFMWYEHGGASYAEWFSVNMATGVRTLINDPANDAAIKAYLSVTPAAVINLEWAPEVTGPWQQMTAAVVDPTARTVTFPIPTEKRRFFRLNASALKKIVGIKVSGGDIVLSFEQAP